MLRKWLCQADIKIVIEPVDPVLIKSGYATLDDAKMVPVSTFKDGKDTYYFPGTSLKGVLRSHLERIARTLKQGSVCIPYYDKLSKKDMIPVPAEQESFGCGFRSRQDGEVNSSSTAYADSCAACRLFGSLKFGGRFSISDAYPLPDHKPSPEARDGIAIDRFTGGTAHGALFDLKVLVGGKFEANLRLTNYELWQLAALNLLLSDLADEMITIGSGRSRGLGRVRITVPSYCLTYVWAVEHLAGLYQLATEEEQHNYCLHHWEPPKPIELREGESRGLRNQYDLSANWCEKLDPLLPSFENFLEWHPGPQGEVSESRSADKQEF